MSVQPYCASTGKLICRMSQTGRFCLLQNIDIENSNSLREGHILWVFYIGVQWRLFWTKTQDGRGSYIQLHINNDRHNWVFSLNPNAVHTGFAF
jgi:hypothetical protein